jgi:hypothetical protein
MEALVILFMPLILMWMLARWVIPQGVLEVALGHLLRDFFWVGARVVGAIIALPFLVISFLLREMLAGPRSRRRRCHGRRGRHNYRRASSRRRFP